MGLVVEWRVVLMMGLYIAVSEFEVIWQEKWRDPTGEFNLVFFSYHVADQSFSGVFHKCFGKGT